MAATSRLLAGRASGTPITIVSVTSRSFWAALKRLMLHDGDIDSMESGDVRLVDVAPGCDGLLTTQNPEPVLSPEPRDLWSGNRLLSRKATRSGIPEERAIFKASGTGGTIGIHVGAKSDIGMTLESSAPRMAAERRRFAHLDRILNGEISFKGSPRRLTRPHISRESPHPLNNSAFPWVDRNILVNGMITDVRYSQFGMGGWIAWYEAGDRIVEIQSNTVDLRDVRPRASDDTLDNSNLP